MKMSHWICAAVLALSATAGQAHHSFTAEFDINKPISFSGTVTRMEWTNPHAWFFVDVKNEAGETETWAMELLGVNRLLREGWTRDKISPGDRLYVEGYAARNGTTTGNASIVIIEETGQQIWGTPIEELLNQ